MSDGERRSTVRDGLCMFSISSSCIGLGKSCCKPLEMIMADDCEHERQMPAMCQCDKTGQDRGFAECQRNCLSKSPTQSEVASSLVPCYAACVGRSRRTVTMLRVAPSPSLDEPSGSCRQCLCH